MFAIESLSLAGEHFDNSASVRKACEFLLGKQMEDGGWGESYKVCLLAPLGLSVDLMLLSIDRRAKRSSTFTTSRVK